MRKLEGIYKLSKTRCVLDLWNQVATCFQIENPIVTANFDTLRSSNQKFCYEIRTLT